MICMNDPVVTICILALFWMAIIGIIAFVYKVILTSCNPTKAPNKIKFKSFVAFYELNPNKWELLDNYVIYETEDKDLIDGWNRRVAKGYINPLIHPAPTKKYYFSFNRKDFRKYRRFQKHVFKQKEIEAKLKEDKHNYKEYKEALEYLKQDLEEFKQSKPWEDIK